jgi:hypothetical protein
MSDPFIPRAFTNSDVNAQLISELNAVRGAAIQSYARLEQSLCGMFAYLAGVTDQIAGIIFFKMVNARSRIAVLERLKRLKHGDEFNLYFNSIMAEAGRLDGLRNQLIHWHTVHSVAATKAGNDWDVFLSPPNFWDFGINSPTMTLDNIREFDDRCDVFSRGLNMLKRYWLNQESAASWRDRFEQPLVYPLPEGHPLIRKPQAPPSPHPA